jgi:hypothetical protein
VGSCEGGPEAVRPRPVYTADVKSAWPIVWLLVAGCAAADGAPPASDDDSVGPGQADAAIVDASIDVDSPPEPPDAARPDAASGSCSPCELVAQCGCATGQACDLGGANGTTACRPVNADGNETSTCTDSTRCAAGYVCLGGTVGASCKRYCASDDQCAGGGGICVIEVTSGGTPIPGVKVCSPSCDPFTASGCPAGWACGAFSDSQEHRNFTWCDVPGTGTNNAACTDDGQCAAGYTCVNVGGATKCKKYCDKGDGNPGCAALQTCVGLVDAAGAPLIVAGVTYGVCN